MVVAHSCSTRLCFNPWHLRWATPEENAHDKLAAGTANMGSHHPLARLDEDRVATMRRWYAEGVPGKELARRFQCAPSTVSGIVHNNAWRHVTASA